LLAMLNSLALLVACAALGYAVLGRRVWTADGGPVQAFGIAALAGIVLFSWVGVLLAAVGAFRPWIVITLAGLALAAAIYRHIRKHDLPSAARNAPVWQFLPGIVLILALAWLNARPAETMMVVDDASVYTLGGISLAKHGSLWHHMENAWPVTSGLARDLFRINPSGTITRHVGSFYQHSFGAQEIEIGFLPLPKVWSALCVWLFGPQHAALGVSVFGILSILSLFLLTRRHLGLLGATVATLTLALCLPQVWFTHYPISEVYAQALLLGGLLLLQNASDEDQPERASASAMLSAASFGLVTLVRFEAVLMLAPLVLFAGWAWQPSMVEADTKRRRWLLAVAVAAGVGTIVAVATSRFYLFDQTLGTAPPHVTRLLLSLGIASGGILAFCRYAAHRWPHRWVRLKARALTAATPTVGLLWALATLIGLGYGLSQPWGSAMPHWLLQYLTPSGLALAFIGLTLWLVRRRKEPTSSAISALLGTAALFAALYALRPMVVPIHPWAMRRLVPLVLPALAFGLGSLAQAVQCELDTRLPQSVTWRLFARGGLCALLALQVYGIARVAAPLVEHREMRGLWAQLVALDASLPENTAVLFDGGEIGQALAPTMELVFDRPSLALGAVGESRQESVAESLATLAAEQGRDVCYIDTDGALDWDSETWSLVPAGGTWIEVPRLSRVEGRPPTSDDLFLGRYTLDIYRLLPAADSALVLPEETVWSLSETFGAGPYLPDGFYPAEQTPTGTFRWTATEAQLELPWPSDEQRADFCLRLSLSGGRPGDEPAAQVTILAEGRTIDQLTLTHDYAPTVYDLPICDLLNGGDPDLEVTVRVNGWSPADYGSADTRELGVALYGLTLAADCEAMPHVD